MDVVATVRSRLLAIDALRTLVSGRIYSAQAPQSPTLPAVVVQRISEQQEGQLRGGQAPRQTRVQVTSIGQSRELAVNVDTAIQGDNAGSGLSFWKGTMGSPSVNILGCFPAGVQEFYDPGELRQYRINRDYLVFHA